MSAPGMRASGSADLYLMGGGIPPWLFERMTRLSRHVVEAIVEDYGTAGFLSRLSDPFWFQSFGAVIGMDWNSSGVTTAVTRALKRSLNPIAGELGLFVAGGKGKASLRTPAELARFGDRTGADGEALARASKLSAKVDNTAVQDGHALYLHAFVVDAGGAWTVIQQGMRPETRSARRYHWHSAGVASFVREPHAAICGPSQGEILNLVDAEAAPAQTAILDVAHGPSAGWSARWRAWTCPSATASALPTSTSSDSAPCSTWRRRPARPGSRTCCCSTGSGRARCSRSRSCPR